MSGNKKRGRGGQQAAKGTQQDRRYWLTSLGANIHKCGRYQDVNRDTAKWRNDVHDMLRTEGGEVLVHHVTQKCKLPKDTRATRLSKSQAAYVSACTAREGEAPNLQEVARRAEPTHDDRALTQLHMAVQQANATVESTR